MDKLVVVQIKGCNGSGKTTIVKQMMDLCDGEVWIGHWDDDKETAYMTAMDGIMWAAAGPYYQHKKMGGCDCLSTVDSIKQAILECIRFAEDEGYFGVVFEGMMISTIKSTFYDFLLELEPRIKPIFVILETTPSGCLARIEGRGTKKPNLKFENLVGKSIGVQKHAITYDQQYVRWLDVEHTPEEDMLKRFLYLVGDTELLLALEDADAGTSCWI